MDTTQLSSALLRPQDIAALPLARDLRDLRLAQRSGACSPRLPVVERLGPSHRAAHGPLGEWSGRPAARAAFGGNPSLIYRLGWSFRAWRLDRSPCPSWTAWWPVDNLTWFVNDPGRDGSRG